MNLPLKYFGKAHSLKRDISACSRVHNNRITLSAGGHFDSDSIRRAMVGVQDSEMSTDISSSSLCYAVVIVTTNMRGYMVL